jgi:hypothetical protein
VSVALGHTAVVDLTVAEASLAASGLPPTEANGKLVKRPDGRLRPRNVEMPLCAVLPDCSSR